CATWDSSLSTFF
nr:immunoglobulin light chain junction region [Macaca mulatta]